MNCRSCGAACEELEEELCIDCWDNERGRNATNRYRNTPKGKLYVNTYNSSQAAKEARKRYASSEKGKLSSKRYFYSDIGKEAIARRKAKLARARRFSELEDLGLCGLCGSEEHAAEFHLKDRENGS